MTVHISHAPDVLVLDTFEGMISSTTFATPVGQTAIAAGGALCGQDRDENDVPFWVPARLPMFTELDGDTATFTAAVNYGQNMCIRGAWISYWED